MIVRNMCAAMNVHGRMGVPRKRLSWPDSRCVVTAIASDEKLWSMIVDDASPAVKYERVRTSTWWNFTNASEPDAKIELNITSKMTGNTIREHDLPSSSRIEVTNA